VSGARDARRAAAPGARDAPPVPRPRPFLVTGAGGGIGAAVVARLVAAGNPVAVADLDLAAAERVAEGIANGRRALDASAAGERGTPAAGAHVVPVAIDVTDLASVRAAVARTVEVFGALGGVVNNAGWLRPEPLTETDDELLRATLAVNLEGPVRVTRECLGELVRFGSGRVVNVASDGALSGMTNIAAYAAAKGGLFSLTRALTLELARHQVTVNTVSPGPTATPLLGATADTDAGSSVIDKIARTVPLRRVAQPDDVAAAVAYFCSEDAAFVTGQTLSVSGGLTRP